MNALNDLFNEKDIFLNYVKGSYPFLYKSNLFLRDLQFAIRHYFETKSIKIGYSEAYMIATKFAEKLVETNEFKKVRENVWCVNIAPEIEEKEEVKSKRLIQPLTDETCEI